MHDGSTVGGTRLATLTGGLVPTTQLPAATTSVQGAVILNNTVTSTSATQALTAAQGKVLNDRAFGVGQTSKSKTLVSGTTYTNTTDKPITLSVSMNGSGSMAASITVNNFLLFSTSVSNLYSCGFTVGVGESYKVTGNNITAIEFS